MRARSCEVIISLLTSVWRLFYLYRSATMILRRKYTMSTGYFFKARFAAPPSIEADIRQRKFTEGTRSDDRMPQREPRPAENPDELSWREKQLAFMAFTGGLILEDLRD
jgi:hypothetical protein